MELSEITPRSSRLHISELPTEIHLVIQNRLLNDPDMTIGQLRSLRLVCKMFNNIWLPYVMTNLVIIPSNLARPPYNGLSRYLQFLVQGKGNTTNITTLTIRNLYCLHTDIDQPLTDLLECWTQGLIETPACFPCILFVTLCAVLLSLTYCFRFLLVRPHKIPYQLVKVVNVYRARTRIASLPGRLDLSNVRCCRLFHNSGGWDSEMHHSTRILLSLPQLTELELSISTFTDVGYLLEPLTTLRKLTLLHTTGTSGFFQIRLLSALIGHNENLTHLSYYQFDFFPHNLSMLFSDVPTDKPLKLHHLSLNGAWMNFEALAPHVRSLFCFEYHSSLGNPWCIPFLGARVFPPMIKVESIDQDLITFIESHPGIASLTIAKSSVAREVVTESLGLFQGLMQHTETLRWLSFNTIIFSRLLQNTENETSFLQCSRNLQELVLDTDTSLADYQNPNTSIQNEQLLFPVIALLSRSLTIVIRTRDKGIFLLCVEFCLGSENALIRNVARRLVYEKRSE